MPLAALVLSQYNRGNIVPAAIETHIARDTGVLIYPGHQFLNPVAVRTGLLDGFDEHLRPIITVAGIYVGFDAEALLEALAETLPGRISLARIEKVSRGRAFGGRPRGLGILGLNHPIKTEESRLHPDCPQLRCRQAGVGRVAPEHHGI